jgi:hypothetical protein
MSMGNSMFYGYGVSILMSVIAKNFSPENKNQTLWLFSDKRRPILKRWQSLNYLIFEPVVEILQEMNNLIPPG